MYSGIVFFSFCVALAHAHCPNFCNGHGHCVDVAKCVCTAGYTGGDCSLRTCPTGAAWADIASATDKAHALAPCSARGHCNHQTGACECADGFTGDACERMVCPNNCNEHGRCVAIKDNTWASSMIYKCVCDARYAGYDCGQPQCVHGDDPLTVYQSDIVQLLRCDMNPVVPAVLTLQWRDKTTRPFAPDTTAYELRQRLTAIVGPVSVTYSRGTTFCNSEYIGLVPPSGNIISVTFLTVYGLQPALTANNADVTIAAHGDSLTYTTDYGAAQVWSVTGTKESLPCSGRGSCNVAGDCVCYAGFVSSDGRGKLGRRGDCGYAQLPTTSCPGFPNECNGNGFCSGAPSYVCVCNAGFSGGDCRERTCPQGPSWVDRNAIAECSDRGSCNRRTGKCACHYAYTGTACERTTCPRSCSGHGQCLSMIDMAAYAKTADGDPRQITYGQNPNYYYTWDGPQIYGCICDSGWMGHDCSQQTCMKGEDITDREARPFLKDEVQTLVCESLNPTQDTSFRLMFRGALTPPIYYASSAHDIRSFMESLSSIDIMDIAFSGHAVCTPPPGNTIQFLFKTEHGDVPSIQVLPEDGWDDTQLRFSAGGHTYLKVAPYGFATIQTAEQQKGTTKEQECSGRGLCDRDAGVCRCFVGFGASNGMRGPGEREDCGWREPFVGRKKNIRGFY